MTGRRAQRRESIHNISIRHNALLAGVNAKVWRLFNGLFFLFFYAFFLSLGVCVWVGGGGGGGSMLLKRKHKNLQQDISLFLLFFIVFNRLSVI